jgi:hypothetical protein
MRVHRYLLVTWGTNPPGSTITSPLTYRPLCVENGLVRPRTVRFSIRRTTLRVCVAQLRSVGDTRPISTAFCLPAPRAVRFTRDTGLAVRDADFGNLHHRAAHGHVQPERPAIAKVIRSTRPEAAFNTIVLEPHACPLDFSPVAEGRPVRGTRASSAASG